MTSEEKRVCYLKGVVTGRSAMSQWFALYPVYMDSTNQTGQVIRSKQAEKDRDLGRGEGWGVGCRSGRSGAWI